MMHFFYQKKENNLVDPQKKENNLVDPQKKENNLVDPQKQFQIDNANSFKADTNFFRK